MANSVEFPKTPGVRLSLDGKLFTKDEVREALAMYEASKPKDPTPPGWNHLDMLPEDTFVMLICPSGYTLTPYRIHVGKFSTDHGYRTHSNDNVTDDGEGPIGWLPIPDGKKLSGYEIEMAAKLMEGLAPASDFADQIRALKTV